MPGQPSPRLALGGLALLASCSSMPTGTMTLVTGEETDVFSRAPAPTTLLVEKVALDGTRTELARTALPTDSISLGDAARTDVGAVRVTGLDTTGDPVVRGESLAVSWGALANTSLELFVQRTGEWARLPRGPSAFDALVATAVEGRYVLGANGTQVVLYDLLRLQTLSIAALPQAAVSLASVGSNVLLVDDDRATTVDLSDGSTYPLTTPSGGTFAEIAGGKRAASSNGTQYLVGGTRLGRGATARVLVIEPEGNVRFASLKVPREGACATYIEGRGLVVYGGSGDGTGAELLAPSAQVATPLPFPGDAIKGCAAAPLDGARIAVAGGVPSGSVRIFDLACTADCNATSWQGDLALMRTDSLALSADALLVVGEDASGQTHAFRASSSGVREIPPRNPRRGARLVRSPTGAALLVGGGGAGIEQYVE